MGQEARRDIAAANQHGWLLGHMCFNCRSNEATTHFYLLLGKMRFDRGGNNAAAELYFFHPTLLNKIKATRTSGQLQSNMQCGVLKILVQADGSFVGMLFDHAHKNGNNPDKAA